MACDDVRKKYFDEFVNTKDLFLFLGTSKQYHFIGPNPFMIIGTFEVERKITVVCSEFRRMKLYKVLIFQMN